MASTVKCRGLGCAEPNSLMESQLKGGGNNVLEILEKLTHKESLPEIRHQLFLKEIRRLNPTLTDGYLFIDGLYEVISNKVPWAHQCSSSEIHNSPRELLSGHMTGSLLLQEYWIRPDDPAKVGTYLTVATSFVSYIHSKYGSRGIAKFLKEFGGTKTVPSSGDLVLNRKDLLTLEFKWKKHVEEEVNERFRLGIFGLLKLLFQSYLSHHWLSVLFVVLSCVADVALHVSFAIIFGKLLDLGFSKGRVEVIVQWVGGILAVIITRFIVLNFNAAISSSMAVKVSCTLRQQIASRIHKVSRKFFSDHTCSEVVSVFSEDVSSIEMFLSLSMYCVMWAGLMLVTCIGYALYVIWPIGLPLGVVFVSMRLLIQWVSSILDKHSFSKMQAQKKLCDILKETVDGFQENRIYSRNNYWQNQLSEVIRKQYTPKAIRSIFLTQFIQLFQLVIPNCLGALLVFGLILLTVHGWIEFKRGVSVYILYQLTALSIASAAGQVAVIHAARVGMGRINALLNNHSHEISAVGPPHIPRLTVKQRSQSESLGVEFRNVCFCYSPIATHWNLCDVSFKVHPGERVAVVGRTGSGKSTLLGLLLQMYLPTSGKVLIGGKETNGRPDRSTAATFQSNHIFNMSIRENIRFGNLGSSDLEVEEAAKMADIHDWIASLSRGYDTVLSSGGTSLSGGQKQRIAIARMLVANAPVLLLDEITSALDPSTEQRVFDTLMKVTRGKTVVAVTHRLEQARQFDKVLVLSHGHVKEYGNHDELIKQKGTYYRMAKKELSVVSPNQPTPIIRQHSLSHLPKLSVYEMTPSPLVANSRVIQPSPLVTTPLDTVEECEERSSKSGTKSASFSTIVFDSLRKSQPNIVVTDAENPLLLANFPKDLPSSTPRV